MLGIWSTSLLRATSWEARALLLLLFAVTMASTATPVVAHAGWQLPDRISTHRLLLQDPGGAAVPTAAAIPQDELEALQTAGYQVLQGVDYNPNTLGKSALIAVCPSSHHAIHAHCFADVTQ
jgi:hypothetical protein